MPNAAAAAITPERVTFYGIASSLAAASVVFRAFRERSNFYAATVWLGRSNGCMLVLLNFVLFMTLVFGRIVQKIFFGQLRTIEIEHLYERSWYSLVDTLLAMAIFRDDFDVSFVLLFGTLLFLKAFHWLSADRVEFMEQSPSVPRLFHVRMIAILWTLLAVDLFLVGFVVELLLFKRTKVGIMILFASEFITLMISLWSTIAKYIINCQDLRSDEPWEAKSMYIFYVDLCNDVLKLATHLSFFVLLTSWYGLPLSQIRDLYVTGRSCASKIRDLVRYRAATKNMDSRYPDATPSDMQAMSDGTCIICREDMVIRDDGNPAPPPSSSDRGLNMTPKRLPCGHIFHFHCLRSWLERQQSCPTCRRSVLDENSTTAAPPNGAAPLPVGAAAPAPGPAPTDPVALPAAANEGEQAAPDGPRAFDQRLQEFLRRIQSDARRVREEGNASARRAGRQSGSNRTPRLQQADLPAAASSSSQAPTSRSAAAFPGQNGRRQLSFGGAAASSSRSGTPAAATSPLRHDGAPGTRYGRASISQPYLPHADPNGGLWVAPPPESLQMPWTRTKAVRRKTHQENKGTDNSGTSNAGGNHEEKGNGAGQSNTDEDDEEEAGDEDDDEEIDEEARARDHAAKLNSWLDALQRKRADNSSGSGAAGVALTRGAGDESRVEGHEVRASATPPQLIPLFDPSRIPHFESVHIPSLPYELLPATPAAAAPGFQPHTAPVSAAATLHNLEALSDEQLQGMAQGSRASLEEYVRVLGQVQADVSALVDQLTRVLSVDPIQQPRHASQLSSASSRDGAGKGKAPAEGLNAL